MKNLIIIFITITTVFVATSVFSQEDLSIEYIQRLPEIEYVEHSDNPAVDGWPTVGEEVTWRAKVKNWGTETATVTYRWYLDGATIVAGQRIINGGTEIDIDSPLYEWTFERKVLKFAIDIGNNFDEVEEDNNELEIFTDAISVGFYVEQSVYDHFHEHQHKLNAGSNSYGDWAHRQVSIWNDAFANAIYYGAPDGVLDRIRLDKITIVPDGTLPLPGGGLPTNLPTIDKTIDLIWGFPKHIYLDVDDYFKNYTDASLSNPFYFDGALFHELGHARYLLDIYSADIEGQSINIQENGVDIDELGLFPAPYYVDIPGLMDNDYTFIDEYSTLALNLIAGHRAICGNANSPCNIGAGVDGFMQDLPAQNRILITDSDGLPVPDANVEIYKSQNGSGYTEQYDDTPDLTLTADQYGYVYVGHEPFSDAGFIHDYNRIIIIRAEKDGSIGYAALECFRFNMEYWRGNTALGTYQLEFDNIVGLPISQCMPDYDIMAHSKPYAYLEAVNTITSSAVIFPGGDITYNAGTLITLTDGFHVQSGSTFHAFIEGCEEEGSSGPDKQDTTLAPDIQLYPNPATHTVHVECELSQNTSANISIFDAFGQLVKNVPDTELLAGKQTLNMDISDLPVGMYFYTLQAEDWTATKKFVVISN